METANISSHYEASATYAAHKLNRVILIMNEANNNTASGAAAIMNGTTGSPFPFPSTAPSVVGVSEDDKAILALLGTLEMYCSTTVISFGIICTILTLMTLQDPDLKEAPYTYLTALAMADLSALVLAFLYYLAKLLKDYISQTSYAYVWWMVYFYYPLINVACTMTTWIMVTMTVERCLYLQFPFRVRTHFTNKRTRIKIMLIFIASLVINFPRFLWYVPEEIPGQIVPSGNSSLPSAMPIGNSSSPSMMPNGNSGSASVQYTIGKYLHGRSSAVVITWIHSTVLHCLPLILLIFLNAFLIYKFRHKTAHKFQLGISPAIVTIWDREQTRLTFTNIAIVGLFVVFIMPSAFADENISKALFSRELTRRVLMYVSNFLMLLNLSLIFAFYAFINTKFKNSFKMMIRRWRARIHYCFYRYCLCGCCCDDGSDDPDFKRSKWSEGNTFYMASHEEQIPFNNNKNRLLNQTSNLSTTSKENSFTTVTFRLIDG